LNATAKKNYRLCLVSDQLATGGAERCAALLSNYFHQSGCEVQHVIVVDKIEYDYSGQVLNLGKLKNNSNGFFNRVKRFGVLKQFFTSNEFDFIIDFRVKRHSWQEFFIANYIYNSPLIVMVHSFMTELYFPKSLSLANKIYAKAVKIVTVSQKIEEKVRFNYAYSQLQTIYNPVDFDAIAKQSNDVFTSDFDYILAIGRMNDDVKQFDQLITCYAKSYLPNKNIHLLFLGDGDLRSTYEGQAKQLGLADKISFKGKIDNPFVYMKNAKFVVLCSRNEGFPTVLIESLACESPVVAFDCYSGPSEIITNNENGILVENQNFNELTLAMNKMISDANFYLHCKQNAKASVADFSLEQIGAQWLQLFKSNS
jgi:glycosyltransferase involved in cell wall biosynthesis